MDFTGSVRNTLPPVFDVVYGSYDSAGGVGSSFVDTLALLPMLLTEMTFAIIALAGADLGSTLGP